MDRYISEADQYRIALTLGQLQGTLASIHDSEETATSERLVGLAEELRLLLFPRTMGPAVAPAVDAD
jgi:hypothetical protein